MSGFVFITGGSGFIGQKLVTLLRSKGILVRALARSQSSAVLLRSMGAEVIQGDILDVNSLIKGANGCSTIFHLAGHPSFKFLDKRNMMRLHVEGTRNIIDVV